ncbi:MAG: ABC transporter substrate-binding protein [Firmicutes bacterium HGW-Firmicutes-9]|jgi:iron complex transport system substrate-binding protein|nr:MAG: ABC transporter substrate-binding protein [Firmicutes bacterium HGW-Firmicutes-9]
MKLNKRLAAILVAMLLLASLIGCAPASIVAPQETEPAGTLQEVTDVAAETTGIQTVDMMGREINLDAPATRVVALSAADCEILYAIGAGDMLVGRGEFCDYPAEVLDVPAVQSGMETNIEQIIALAPQVLLMSAMAQTEDQVKQLEAAGIQCVVSDAKDINGVYQSITLIGAITGRDEDAFNVLTNMEATLSELSVHAGELQGKSIYFEVSPLQYGLWTAGKGTFMDEVAIMLGLTNVFADTTGWAEISEEQVLKANPDVIVTIAMYFGEGQTPVEEILSRPGWQDVTAVKNGDIFNLPNNELSRPGPRIADGAMALFDFIKGIES